MQFPMLNKKQPFNQTKPANFTAHKAKISETENNTQKDRLKQRPSGHIWSLSTGIWDHQWSSRRKSSLLPSIARQKNRRQFFWGGPKPCNQGFSFGSPGSLAIGNALARFGSSNLEPWLRDRPQAAIRRLRWDGVGWARLQGSSPSWRRGEK